MSESCCPTMHKQLNYNCPQHGNDCPDCVITRGEMSGRLFLTAPNASYDFKFCPWCGTEVEDNKKPRKPFTEWLKENDIIEG